MRTCFTAILLSVFLCCCLWISEKGQALPLFAMQAASSCQSCHVEPDSSDPKWVEENYAISERKCRLSCNVCHVNPSGGMLRNETGMYFGRKTLPWHSAVSHKAQQTIETIKDQAFFTLGGDFRFLGLAEEDRDKNPVIFPMQADLYASADLLAHVTAFTQFGMERGGNPNVREAMGILGDFPYNSYMKFGKFMPPYGHRLDDHTAFIRTKTNFDHSQPEAYPAGVEIGAEPLVFFGRLAFFQDDVAPAANTERTKRGFSSVAGWRGLWLHLGASYVDIENFRSTQTLTTDRSAYGIFGGVRYGNVVYLFELDQREDVFISPDGATETDYALISFNEVNYKAHKGLNFKLRYETFDPDDDATEASAKRFMAGVDLFPYPYTEIKMEYRYNEEDDNKNQQILLIGHLWF